MDTLMLFLVLAVMCAVGAVAVWRALFRAADRGSTRRPVGGSNRPKERPTHE